MDYVNQAYGQFEQSEVYTDLEFHVECIRNRGFTIVDNVLNDEEIALSREKMDHICLIQEAKFEREQLLKMKELDVARMLFAYDEFFLSLAVKSRIIEIVGSLLKQKFILNLQNGIIIKSDVQHHQTSWHRDLPYQNYVSSRPLAVNALFCIDRFSNETGGTVVVPFSHRMEAIPSQRYIEANMVCAEAEPGSAIVFDSMLFHRGGYNRSGQTRRAINHLYTVPIIKQQVDIPRMLNGRFADDPNYSELLGYSMQTPISVEEWRTHRLQRS